ncbi:alpha/beta hydrolase [Pseudonocardia spinosispora]|uniref:alpha/beta hydrolase n=1 Tax=Pseudonocardia spinosispora TaxID=103441 RepID=UPI000417EA07|nr:alpha/beta hydrolase [Pseudonocardia spinosispora]
MTTFVLVPGGWHGAWAIQALVRELRGRGHEAFPVTLTGVGERRHLASASVNLDTHIQDVLAVLETEEITDAVLVGHSYAGMVITGVADRAPSRISRLVYSDAYVPADGQSCFELTNDVFRQVFLQVGADGYSVPAPAGTAPRATPHPLASFMQPIRLTEAPDNIPARDYLYLSDWADTPFTPFYERFRDDPAWRVHVVAAQHNMPTVMPELMADVLTGEAPAR